MNSKDAKELSGFFVKYEGMTKGQALAHLKALSDDKKVEFLNKYRHSHRPTDFVSIDQLRSSGEKYFPTHPPKRESQKERFSESTPASSAKKSKKIPYTFLITPAELDRFKAISESDGESVSFHIRKALRRYSGDKVN